MLCYHAPHFVTCGILAKEGNLDYVPQAGVLAQDLAA